LAARSDVLENRKKLRKVNKACGVIPKSKRPVEGAPGADEGKKHDPARYLGLAFSMGAEITPAKVKCSSCVRRAFAPA
jgi:hypothetical protein